MAHVAWPRRMRTCKHGLRRGAPAYLIATSMDLIVCQKCADARKEPAMTEEDRIADAACQEGCEGPGKFSTDCEKCWELAMIRAIRETAQVCRDFADMRGLVVSFKNDTVEGAQVAAQDWIRARISDAFHEAFQEKP